MNKLNKHANFMGTLYIIDDNPKSTYRIIANKRTCSNKRTPMLLGHDRACSQLSDGGFGLKIGPFLAEIQLFL